MTYLPKRYFSEEEASGHVTQAKGRVIIARSFSSPDVTCHETASGISHLNNI